MLVILEVDGREKVGGHLVGGSQGRNDEVVGPGSKGLNLDILVCLTVRLGLVSVLALSLGELVVVLVKVIYAHDDPQVRVVAHGDRDGFADGLETVGLLGRIAGDNDDIIVLCGLGQDSVEQLVVRISVLSVHIVGAKFELDLLGQGVQKGVLGLGRKLGENEVALRLILAPDVLESAGVEYGEDHEVFRVQRLLAVVEVALGVFHYGVLLALLEHLTGPQTRDADLFLDPGDDADESLGHDLVAGRRNG